MPFEGYSIESVYDSMVKAQTKLFELKQTYMSVYGEWEIKEYDVL